MVWGCPRYYIMQERRGSWLTVRPHLHTLMNRDKNLGSMIGKTQREGWCGTEKPETHLTWYPVPWQHREAGSGLSCDLTPGYMQPETWEILHLSVAVQL